MKQFFAIRTDTETDYIYDFVDLPGCVSITKIADEYVQGFHFKGYSDAFEILERWLSEHDVPGLLRSEEQFREQFPDARIQLFDVLEEHEIRAQEKERRRWHENGKRRGGTICNWQLHKMTSYPGDLSKKEYQALYSEALLVPFPLVFTGKIVEDLTGRFQPGDHMRSSAIVSIDRESGEIETLNSVYKIELSSEGCDFFDDLGNDALNLFY
jgi:hypothetical protein